MKRWFVFFGLFVGVFLIGVVDAGSCADSDRIMKLYSSTNSHGALWDDTNYEYDICYSNIFGSVYTGANPHDCLPGETNKVLGLYQNTNSHAEIPSLDNYDVDVCYGDLVCQAVTDPAVCPADYRTVVRLYQNTNSHISNASDTNYSVKICCEGGVSGPSVLEWRDMSGNVIASSNVGNTVRMVMTNSLAGSFEIFESDFVTGDDPIRVGADAISGVVDGSNFVGLWTITDEDLAKTNDYGDFYFAVDGETSGFLSVDFDDEDDPMNITIVSPGCGDDYDESETTTIKISAIDKDDLIDGKVTIGSLVVPFSNGEMSFDYDFDVPGNYQVVVEAVNSRGKRSRVISNVMVLDKEGVNYVDGSYVAACIDEPKDFSNIPGSIVNFDASSTRGIKVIGGVVSDVFPGSNSLDFYWSFSPDGRVYGKQYTGTGNSLAYDFITEFAVAGNNLAVLRVEMN